MNRVLITTVLCIFITIVQSVKYEDYYSEYARDESEEKPPIYDLKDAPELFEKFIKDYHKEYKNKVDYNKHYDNFVLNLKYINSVNKEGGSSSSDINLFTDLGDDELSVIG